MAPSDSNLHSRRILCQTVRPPSEQAGGGGHRSASPPWHAHGRGAAQEHPVQLRPVRTRRVHHRRAERHLCRLSARPGQPGPWVVQTQYSGLGASPGW